MGRGPQGENLVQDSGSAADGRRAEGPGGPESGAAPAGAPSGLLSAWHRLVSFGGRESGGAWAGPSTWSAALAGLGLDLALTLLALGLGWSAGASHVLGFLSGVLAAGVLRRRMSLSGPRPGRVEPATLPGIGWSLVLLVSALGLRGGIFATGLVAGLPGWLAVAAGIGLSWGVLAGGGALHHWVSTPPVPPPAWRWDLLSVGILVGLLLLHLVYVRVLPVMPEEAYYWNYAIRPALGYLDHPPMVAWLIGLSEAAFGHGRASLRLPGLLCGALLVAFLYRFADRLVDRPAALVAAALAAVLPYPFFAAGLMMTPDAPLAAAWAASLYFLHRALIGGERRAWYGAGIALGLGMLSKYTIFTLGLGALAFGVLDRRARGWFLRPEPYAAVLIALLLFSPVIYWNWANDWASFRFQSGGRFGEETQFSLHLMLLNMLLVATPLPLLALPLLFSRRWSREPGRAPDPPQAELRNRLFVGCAVLVPLAIFGWSALSHPPRLNWTGPIWLATLPLLGWALVRADVLAWGTLGKAIRLSAAPVLGSLLALYAAFSFYAVLGIPGVPYPRTFARAAGWSEATRALGEVQDRIARETGARPVIVGMDKYNIASQVSFHGAGEGPATGRPALRATTIRALSGSALMFSLWDPPEQFLGRTLILVAQRPETLATERLSPQFGDLGPEIHELPLSASWPGGNGRAIDTYYYRIGRGYGGLSSHRQDAQGPRN